MSGFYKILVILVFACFGADYAYSAGVVVHELPHDAFDELRRGSRIAAFSWHSNRNDNTIILSDAGLSAATIFTLQFGDDKGKIGVYFNGPNGKVGRWPFKDALDAKEWVIKMAAGSGVALARS